MNPLQQLDKWFIEEMTRPRTEQLPTLQETTIQTPEQQEATRIKNEFDEMNRVCKASGTLQNSLCKVVVH